MKHTLLLFVISLFSFACTAQDKTTYGKDFKAEKTMTLADLTKTLKDGETEVVVTGTITSSCSKKGCWMTMSVPNQEDVRVTFKDYKFFVPTEGLEGKTAIVKGLAKMQTTDVATLQHLAEDAGKSKEEIAEITEDKKEITLVATGVQILN